MTQIRPGQVAVVTGAAAGIGFALAGAFVARGVRVVLADVDAAALEKAEAALRSRGGDVVCVATDVADRAAVEALRDTAVGTHGRVDILCNNAGVYPGMRSLWEIDLADWKRLIDVNYWGVVHGIQAFTPLFIAQGGGHVVNTASMSGLSTVPGSADYGSSKHAVIALTETLRADLDLAGQGGIGVTVLCPSLVMTDMGRRALGVFDRTGTLEERKSVGSGPDLSAVLEPDALADAALAGIEAGHLYVLPTPQSRDRFLKRVRPVLDAFAAYPQAMGSIHGTY